MNQKLVIDATNDLFNKYVEYSEEITSDCSKVNDVVFIKTHKVDRILLIQSSVKCSDWQQLHTEHILEIWSQE